MGAALMTIEAASQRRDICLIDIRPWEERRELGSLPGAIGVHTQNNREAALDTLVRGCQSNPLLYCTSGHRSGEMIETRFKGTSALSLDGGSLGWRAAGLPACDFPEECNADVGDADQFIMAMRSCFVGQTVETVLDFGLETDPLELFESCVKRIPEGCYDDGLTYLRALIEQAACTSRWLGTSLESIVKNTCWAYANAAKFYEQQTPSLEAIMQDVRGSLPT